MSYINPARKVIAGAKRALPGVKLTLRCPKCSDSHTRKFVGLKREDLYCPTCGTQLERSQIIDQAGNVVQGGQSSGWALALLTR